MLRRRTRRLTTAFFVVWSLLFSQLALASYVCPAQADVRAMAERMAAGEPCEGMDAQQPLLCHEHVADPGKAFEAVHLPTAATPAIVQVLPLPTEIDADQARTIPMAQAPGSRPPPDPLFLATLRLRV